MDVAAVSLEHGIHLGHLGLIRVAVPDKANTDTICILGPNISQGLCTNVEIVTLDFRKTFTQFWTPSIHGCHVCHLGDTRFLLRRHPLLGHVWSLC